MCYDMAASRGCKRWGSPKNQKVSLLILRHANFVWETREDRNHCRFPRPRFFRGNAFAIMNAQMYKYVQRHHNPTSTTPSNTVHLHAFILSPSHLASVRATLQASLCVCDEYTYDDYSTILRLDIPGKHVGPVERVPAGLAIPVNGTLAHPPPLLHSVS